MKFTTWLYLRTKQRSRSQQGHISTLGGIVNAECRAVTLASNDGVVERRQVIDWIGLSKV